MTEQEAAAWREYDLLATDCARRGIKGNVGDVLPSFLSTTVCELINDDPEAFQLRIRQSAYALAMEKIGIPEE